MSELLALIEGRVAARIRADKSGRLTLEYESAWRQFAQSFPLSVMMPLTRIVYPQKIVSPYLWNLLPENPNVLHRWGQQYHVSAGCEGASLGDTGGAHAHNTHYQALRSGI